MKQMPEKNDNQKAFPKFILTLLLCALLGGVLGFATGLFGSTALPETIADKLYELLAAVLPWSIWVSSALLLGGSALQCRKAYTLFAGWDGEDEAHIERAESAINRVSLLLNIAMILSFFFFGAGVQPQLAPSHFLLFLLSFLLTMAGQIFLSQKIVDLAKKINPEKQGSVYDMKFQKTWLDSCDENEQRQIGQASLKAFQSVNYACLGLWIVLIVLSMTGNIGVLPILTVTLLWGVNMVSYLVEAIRMGRRS